MNHKNIQHTDLHAKNVARATTQGQLHHGSHFIYSYLVNSHFVNVHKVRIDKRDVEKMRVDKTGIDEKGIGKVEN